MKLGLLRRQFLFWGAALLFLPSCGDINKFLDQYDRNHAETPAVYFFSISDVTVEVAYEQNAVPFTGVGFNRGNLWDFVEENLKAAFRGRGINVVVPKEISEMKALPALGKDRYTAKDIVDLSGRVRNATSSKSHAHFLVLFLDAMYEESPGKVNPKILGISVSGTTVVAIFKPAELLATEGSQNTDPLPKYLEQSTIVHEMGHALGLVNNGVPLKSPHHDAAHGAHCTNARCVMYYQNEGVLDMRRFVVRFMSTGNLVAFGAECLNDLTGYHP